jgi:pimeloyl-ACP methyl ester carboxylesterase
MPVVVLDGIPTRYELIGQGPPLLMLSPGGFDSSLENWTRLGRYRDLGFVAAFAPAYTCVLFDRRESGQSGGRVQRLTWEHYVTQALALINHLGLERVHAMGGCVGCSTAAALAVAAPGRVRSLVLFSPAGGPRYRMAQHRRFAEHLAFAASHGLAAVADLAWSTSAGFSTDPRVGPWAAPLRTDETFAACYAAIGPARYQAIVAGTVRGLFDRDTVPGVEAEDLMTLDVPALIVPGEDASHAPSAARYLQECLPANEFWDVPVAGQTAGTAPARILDFLRAHDS